VLFGVFLYDFSYSILLYLNCAFVDIFSVVRKRVYGLFVVHPICDHNAQHEFLNSYRHRYNVKYSQMTQHSKTTENKGLKWGNHVLLPDFSLLVIGGSSGFLGNYRLPGVEQTHIFFDT
jgi:hypothetical protein